MALTRSLTLDEFLREPEEQPALEYERGVITQKVSPMARHGKLQMSLGIRFESHGYPDQILSAFSETRVAWPVEGVSYVPDLIAYFVDRVPFDADGRLPNRLFVPPDIAVEIPSPGQGLNDQMDRCRWYVAHGVPISLLAHPDREAIWVFRLNMETGPLTGDAVVDLAPEIPGFAFVVAELFSVFQRRPR